MAGFSIFAETNTLKELVAFCNSCVAKYYLTFLAPTLNFMIGPVTAMPIVDSSNNETTIELTDECISCSKTDWDSYETSWDFKKNPLL